MASEKMVFKVTQIQNGFIYSFDDMDEQWHSRDAEEVSGMIAEDLKHTDILYGIKDLDENQKYKISVTVSVTKEK